MAKIVVRGNDLDLSRLSLFVASLLPPLLIVFRIEGSEPILPLQHGGTGLEASQGTEGFSAHRVKRCILVKVRLESSQKGYCQLYMSARSCPQKRRTWGLFIASSC